MTPKQIKEKLKTDGFIKLRSGYYRIVQANEETIESQALLQQLKDEGKYKFLLMISKQKLLLLHYQM